MTSRLRVSRPTHLRYYGKNKWKKKEMVKTMISRGSYGVSKIKKKHEYITYSFYSRIKWIVKLTGSSNNIIQT